MSQKVSFFYVKVGRMGDIWVDDFHYSLLEFKRGFAELLGIRKEFRVTKACFLVKDGQINKIKILIKDNGGTLV